MRLPPRAAGGAGQRKHSAASDELLNREISDTLLEMRVLVDDGVSTMIGSGRIVR